MAWFRSRYTQSLEARLALMAVDLELEKKETSNLRAVNAELKQQVFDLRITAASKEPQLTAGDIIKKPRPSGGNWLRNKAALESAQGEIVENPEMEN